MIFCFAVLRVIFCVRGFVDGYRTVFAYMCCHSDKNRVVSGSIQTGRANVKTTASPLYENYDAARPV